MTITLIAAGSRGDVQPYIALGRGLADAGYSVRILSSDDFAGLVEQAGLPFASIGESTEEIVQSAEWKATLESGNMISILRRMNAEMQVRAREQVARIPALAAGSDLLIAGLNALGGITAIAEKLRLPLLQAYLLPLTPTRSYASVLVPVSSLGGPLNRASFHLTRQMLWQSFRVGDSAARAELSLTRAPFWGPFRALAAGRTPVLYGFSPHVLPRPADWDANTHVTGYWFLDPPAGWTPPADLAAFLDAGPPPVYIGFGSMGNRDPEAAAALSLRALELSGQRGILASGWGGLRPVDVPETVHLIQSVPHSWLFPRLAAVVHHGGAGTIVVGLRAGVPSIVVPFFADQPFWGRRVAQLGVGPAPLPRRKLTADRLAAAIDRAVSDSAMRRAAADLGARIRAEDGIANAVAVIRRYLDRGAA